MHIEPGLIAPAKVMAANVAAVGVVAWGLKEQVKAFVAQPFLPVKTLLAAGFFSLFMQAFHMPVGPSELHFIGAMAMYLTLGFLPTLLGFALGLVFQGLAFEPGDLPHLAVNSLSLMLPLMTVHALYGRRLFADGARQTERFTLARAYGLDASYHAGVVAMVGFWLAIAEDATPFADWLRFAASYLIVVALEPLFTYGVVRGLAAIKDKPLVARLTAIGQLRLA